MTTTMPQKQGGKTPSAIPGVGKVGKTPQNQGCDVAVWDSRACRVRLGGRFASIQTADLAVLLHYRLITALDGLHAAQLAARLMAMPLPPSLGNQDVMVLRGRVAMALSDLRERLAKNVV